MKIFISYKSEEYAIVSKLCEDLKANGFDFWIDKKELLGGKAWEDEIEKALAECSHMIAVLTPEAPQSHVIRAEWGFFLNRNKPVFPLLLRDTHIPFLLQQLQYVDFRPSYDLGLIALIDSLRNAMLLPETDPKPNIPEPPMNLINMPTWSEIHSRTAIFSEKALGADYKEKYEPQSYLQRQEVFTQFQAFVDSDKTVTVLTGKAGTGKSSFICSLISEKIPNLAVWICDCRQLQMNEEATIKSYIHKSLELSVNIDALAVFRHLAASDPSNRIVFIFDAVNEAIDPKLLLAQLSNFVLHIDSPAIKVLITCRMPTWESIRRSFEASVLKEFHSAGPNSYISLSGFEGNVLQSAYEKYQVNYGIVTPFSKLSREVKVFISDPLLLKLTAISYQFKSLPDTLALNEVFDAYVKKCLCGPDEDCDPFITPEFVILRKAIELMFVRTQRVLHLSLLKQDAEIAKYIIDETIGTRTPYTNLISEGLLSQEFALKIATIYVRIERVFEYLLAQLMIPRVTTKSIEELLKTAKSSSFMQLRGAAELALSLSIINGDQPIDAIVELARSNQLESRQFLSDVIQTIHSLGKVALAEKILDALIEDDHVESNLLAIQVAYQLRFDQLLAKLTISTNEQVHDIASLYAYQRWNKARLRGDLEDAYKVIKIISDFIRWKNPKDSTRAMSVLVFLSVNIFAHVVDDAKSLKPLVDIYKDKVRAIRQDPNQTRPALEKFLADRALDVVIRFAAIALETNLNRAGFFVNVFFDSRKAFRDLFDNPHSKRIFLDSSFFWEFDTLINHEDVLVQILTKENPLIAVHFRAPLLFQFYSKTKEHLPFFRRLLDRTEDFPVATTIITNVIVYSIVYKLIREQEVSEDLLKEAQDMVIELWYKLDEKGLLNEVAHNLTGIFHAEAILQTTMGAISGSETFKYIISNSQSRVTTEGVEILLNNLERFAYQGYPKFAMLTLMDENVRKVWEARAYAVGIRVIANLRTFYQEDINSILNDDVEENRKLRDAVKMSGSTPKPSEVSAYAFLLLGIATGIDPIVTKMGGNIIMDFATTKSINEALQRTMNTMISALYNFDQIDINFATWFRRHDPTWDNFEKYQIPRYLDNPLIQPEMRKYAEKTVDDFIKEYGLGIIYGDL